MLFIPLEKNIDWKKPPIITITLIIINVICYFGFQMNDDERYSEAISYYFQSGLAEIEAPYYVEHLENKNKILSFFKSKSKDIEKKRLSKKEIYSLYSDIRNDGGFLAKLEQDKIIKNGDENYSKWKNLSEEYYRKLNSVTFYSYGLKGYQVTLGTLFSHMFLHANFEHLFWNMVFLFVFGFSVEMILGWKIYLPTYILAGIGSGIFYTLLEPTSAIPGIGASGAISGLTGMYTVLFGLRKIRFFYFVFVFFDTVKAPALIILPLWLGYEFYNHYFIPSNINNLAHAGGLISGALIAYFAKKWHKNINIEYMDENNNKENFDKLYSKALSQIGELKIDSAKNTLSQLNKEYPQNLEVLGQLFNLSKFKPEIESFHQIANEIFSLEANDAKATETIHEVFNEYIAKAKPRPKLKADLMIKLVSRFLKGNYLESAEKLILILINNKVKHKDMSVIIEIMINKFKTSNSEKVDKYQNIYNKLFSVS